MALLAAAALPRLAALLLVLAASLAVPLPGAGGTAHAAVLVSNFGQTADGGTTYNATHAVATFMTGASATTLTSIEFELGSGTPPPATLYTGSVSGAQLTRGTMVATLTAPSVTLTSIREVVTYTASASLAASTFYLVVLETPAAGISIGDVAYGSVDAGGAAGWTIGGKGRGSSSPYSYLTNRTIKIRVNGSGGTPANNAPTVANPIDDQTATAGTALLYAFPTNTFADTDAGDTLTYTAAQSDDSALPSWLSFAAATRTFSGTPMAADVGTVSVKVTASDGTDSVNDTFDIVVSAAANNAPVFADATASRSFTETVGDAAVSTAGSVGAVVTATDADGGDTLTYSLEGTDVAKFGIVSSSGQIQTKVGEKYDREAKASYSVTVKADDSNGGSDTIAVTINVDNAEEKPVAPAMPTVTATSGSTTSLDVSWAAPANTGRPAITGYKVEYRPGVSGNWLTHAHTGTGTTATIASLTAATSYQVQVLAVNSDGDGAFSSPGAGTTGTATSTAATGKPGITGTAQVGWTLTATVGTIADVDGLPDPFFSAATTTVQWIQVDGVNESDISGATSETYTLVTADAGKTIKVKVSFWDEGYTPEGPLTSDAYPSSGTVQASGTPVSGVLVSNVGQGGSHYTSLSLNDLAQRFTTGTNAAGYTLTSIELRLNSADSTNTPTVKLHSASATGTEVATLTGPAMLGSGAGNYTFTPSSTVTLRRLTTYWVVAEGDAGWETTISSEDATPAPGWEIGDRPDFRAASSTGPFGPTMIQSPLKIRVNGTFGGVVLSNDATLNALALEDASDDSAIAISPVFASGTTSYTASVGNGVDEITIEPTVNESSATVEYLDSSDTPIADSDSGKTGQQVSLLVGANTIKVKVTAEDTTTNTYTVVVTRAANTAPTSADEKVEADEDFDYTFASADFAFTDTDAGDSLASVKIVTLPASGTGTLTLSDTAIGSGDLPKTVLAAEIGNLKYSPPANLYGTDVASFTFKVNDGTVDSDNAYTITIDVKGEDDSATGKPGITGTAQVGQTLTATVGTIADADGLPDPFISHSLTTIQWIQVDGVNETDISGATSETYALATADEGKKIKVKVSFEDEDGKAEGPLTSDAYPASGTVTAASTTNTAPTAANKTVTTGEDRAYTFTEDDFGFMDADTGAALASVKIVTPPALGTLALDGTAVMAADVVTKAQIDGDMLTFTPARDAHGVAYTTFTFKVNDGTDDSASAYTMTIDVTDAPAPVCAAPSFGDRREIWSGTVTVEEFSFMGSVTGYGFDGVLPAGTLLPSQSFFIGSNNYVIDAITVSLSGSLHFSLDGFSFLTATETAALRLHVCDGDYDFDTANNSQQNTTTWSTSLDWSPPVVTRTVYLSLPANNVATGEPAITGTAQVGQVLTADASPIMDDDGLPSIFTYQWLRVDADGTSNEEDITGEIAATYTLTDDDVGKKIKVKVGFVDILGGEETRTSAASGTVPGTNTAPVFSPSNVSRSIAENTAAGVDVGAAVTATDADAGDNLTYTLGGADVASFDIVGTSGQIRTKTNVSYDFEAKSSYTVTVTATDNSNATAVADVTIGVTDVDEPPSAPATPMVSAVSGSTTSLSVSWAAPANAGKPAIDNYDVQYREGTSGAWTDGQQDVTTTSTTITSLTANTLYQARVRATNAEGDSGWSEPPGSGRTNTPSNNAPVFSPAMPEREIAENTAAGQNVGAAVTATDADAGDTLGYTLGGPDAAAFDFVETTGQIRTKTNVSYDFEAKSSYTVTVTASDGTATADASVTISVTDVDEPPSAPATPMVSAVSGSTTRLTVSWAAPANAGKPAIASYDVQYRLGSSGTWSDGPEDVATTTATITSLVANTLYEARVRASNAEGDSDWSDPPGSGQTNLSTNTAPTAADKTVTTTLNRNYTFLTTDFGFEDADSGAALASVKIVTLPAVGNLALDGTDVTLNQVVTRAEIDAANLKFEPATDASGTGYASFDFKVNDGTDDSVSAYTMTIDVAIITALGAPTALTATASGQAWIELAWTAPVHVGGRAITGYRIEVSPDGASDWTELVANTASTATTYVHKGLNAGATRHYRVSAINVVGASDPSGSDHATTRTDEQLVSNFNYAGDADNVHLAVQNVVGIFTTGSRDAKLNSIELKLRKFNNRTVAPALKLHVLNRVGGRATLGAEVATLATPATSLTADSFRTFNYQAPSGTSLTASEEYIFVLEPPTIGIILVETTTDPSEDDVKADGWTIDGSGGGLEPFYIGSTRQIVFRVNGTQTPNTAPTAAGNTVTMAEDGRYEFSATDFRFHDTNPADRLVSVRIETLPALGALALDRADVTLNQVVTKTQIDAGDLTFRPAAGGSGNNYARFNFKVNDGTVFSASAYTMRIDVTPTPPLTGQIFVDNTAETDYLRTVADNRSSQSFTTGPNRGGYILTSIGVVAQIVGENGVDDFSVAVHNADANGAPVALHTSLTPPGNFPEEVSTIHFHAPSNTRLRPNTTYSIVLGSGRTPSRFRQISATQSNADNASGSGWSIGDALHSRRSAASPWSSPNDGRSVKIVIRGNTASGVANNAPVFSPATVDRSIAENTAAGRNVGAVVTATDADNDPLTYTLGGADMASFDIDEFSGQIRTKAGVSYDHEAKPSYTVTVTASDGIATADADVTISVTDVNEPPRAPATPVVSAVAQSAISLTVTWAAPANAGRPAIDSYDVQYRASGATDWIDGPDHSTTTAVTGLVAYTLHAARVTGLIANTEYEARVRAVNDEGNSGWSTPPGAGRTNTLTNNAPVFSPAIVGRSIAENTAADVDIGLPVTATDDDAGDTLGYTLGGAGAEFFDFVEASGQIRTKADVSYDFEARSSYTVTVTASDGTVSAAAIVTISVIDVAEPPDAPATPEVTPVTGSTTSLAVSWAAPDNDGRPAIDGYDVQYRVGGSGTWTDVPQVVTGTTATITGLTAATDYQVQVRAANAEGDSGWSDPPGAGRTRPLTHIAPMFSSSSQTRDIAENTGAGVNVGAAVTATDVNNDPLGYTLGGADAGSFDFVETTGQILTKTGVSYNHEAKPSYTVTVTASDGAATAVATVTINVTDVAEPPDAPATPIVSAVAGSTHSLSVSWTAPANEGRPPIESYSVQWRVSGATVWRAKAVDAPTTTTIISELLADTEYEVRVNATNDEGYSGFSDPPWVGRTSTTLTNNVPVFSSSNVALSIAENTAAGVAIGAAVTATDADAGDTLTYTLRGADAEFFDIVDTTGQIRTKDNVSYDFEAKPAYTVTVRVSDGDATAEASVIISITDVDEAPDAPATPTVSAVADSTTRLTVSWDAPANAGKPDIDSYDVQYRLSGATAWINGPRNVATTTTTVTGLTANTLYEAQVRATNHEGDSGWSDPPGSGRTNSATTNNAPVFSSSNVTRDIAENTAAGRNVGAAVAATDDDGDTLGYTLGGADVAFFDFVEATGQIRTKSGVSYDHEAEDSYTVTVTASDGAATAVANVTISITDEDEPPDAPAMPTVSAVSGSATSLSVSWAAPANAGRPAIANYDVQYRASGSGTWTDGPQNVTGTTETISGLVADTEYEVQVRATNDEGDSGWSTPPGAGRTNAPGNNAPVFNPASVSRSIAENTSAGQNVGAAVEATDGDGDTLSYTLGGADKAAFEIDRNSGQIRTISGVSYDHEAKASYTVTVTASDGTATADASVTIRVTDVDEPPSAPATPMVSAVSGSTTRLSVSWAAPANAGKPAIANYDVQYRVGSSGTWSDGPEDVTGTTTAVSGLVADTLYEARVRATNAEGDSGWSEPPGSGRTNAPTNNAPVFDPAMPEREIAENTAAGVDVGAAVTATDADAGDNLTYMLGGADMASFDFVETTGQIRTKSGVSYDHEAKSSYTVTVTASDGTATADASVTIRVTDVDEPPSAPATPMVSAVSGSTTRLSVSWAAPANAGKPAIANYDVQYRVGSSGTWSDGPEDVTGTTTAVSGLVADTLYEARVRATNAEGDSGWSEPPGSGRTNAPTNNAPVFDPAMPEREIAENTAAGVDVGAAVTATDADAGDNLTYMLGGADMASFDFVETTGQIRTKAGVSYDHEAKSSYTVTVTASDGTATADASVTIRVTDVDEPPSAPATPMVSAVSGSTTSLSVSWAAPANAGKPAIANYDVQYRVGSSGTWSDGPVDVAGTSTAVSGLVADTLYEARVRATNAEGDSGWSEPPGSGRTNASSTSAPGAPGDLRTTPGDGRVTLAWTAPESDGGAAILKYQYRAQRTGTTAWTDVPDGPDAGGSAADETTFTVSGLSNGTEYVFQLRAVNSVGEGRAASATGTPVRAPLPPGSGFLVSNFGQRADGASQISVTQDIVGVFTTGARGAELHNIEFRLFSRLPNIAQLPSATLYRASVTDTRATPGTRVATLTAAPGSPRPAATAQTVAFTAPGGTRLEAGATYLVVLEGSGNVRVESTTFPAEDAGGAPGWAIDGIGAGNSSPYSYETTASLLMRVNGTAAGATVATAPDAPASLGAAAGDARVNLIWTPPRSDGGAGIEKYQYRYSAGSRVDPDTAWTDVPDGSDSGTSRADERSVSVTELDNGRQYAFELRAVNGVRAGAAATATATPAAARRTGFLVSNFGQTVDGSSQISVTQDIVGAFTAGALGATLDSIELRLYSRTPDIAQRPSATLYRGSVTATRATPGTRVATLTAAPGSPRPAASAQTIVFTAPGGTRLEAGATYLVVLEGSGYVRVEETNSSAQDAGGASGWTIDGVGAGNSSPYSYGTSGSLLMSVNGTTASAQRAVREEAVREKAAKDEQQEEEQVQEQVQEPATSPDPDRGISLSTSSSSAIEGQAVTISVRRAGPTDRTTSVAVQVFDSALTGAWPIDLDFRSGVATATATVAIPFDGARPASRTVTVRLASVEEPYSVGSPSTLTFNVTDRDAALSVDDASVSEGPGATLAFAVTLDRTRDREVRVKYATSDGTATQGDDYTGVSGTLRFAAGETSKTVSVTVLDDTHNEGSETLTLTLSSPRRAVIDDDTAVGTIVNSDPLPDAWLSRFGRAASDQVVQSIGRRLDGGTRESHLTVMGWRVDSLFESSHPERDGRAPRPDAPGWQANGSVRAPDGRIGAAGAMTGATRGVGAMSGPGAARPAFDGAMTQGFPPMQGGTLQSPARAMGGLPANAGGNPGAPDALRGAPGVAPVAVHAPAAVYAPAVRGRGGPWAEMLQGLLMKVGAGGDVRAPGLRDMVMGSSFYYGYSPDAGLLRGMNRLTAWGESASTRFSGAEGKLSLDGEVNTAILGADGEWGRWLAGLALSYSEGEGGYRQVSAKGGAVSSTLSGINPYARYRLNERTSLWATLGYGSGRLTLTPDGAESSLETDMTNAMAAFGGRGVLSMRAGETGQFELAVRTDAMLTDTASIAVPGLSAGEGATSRIRLILEGSGSLPAFGGVLAPKVEAGLRYDGGDAETGAGLEVGGGLAYEMARLTVQVDGRVLLTHQDQNYEEWGYSLSFVYQPGEDGRGLRYQAGSQWGAAHSGVQSLWSLQNAGGLANGAPTGNGQRYTAELGYGFGVGRLWYPYVATESGGASSQALRFGLNLNAGSVLEAGVEIGRRAHLSGQIENDIRLRWSARW